MKFPLWLAVGYVVIGTPIRKASCGFGLAHKYSGWRKSQRAGPGEQRYCQRCSKVQLREPKR